MAMIAQLNARGQIGLYCSNRLNVRSSLPSILIAAMRPRSPDAQKAEREKCGKNVERQTFH